MAIAEEEAAKKKPAHAIGEDLSLLSLYELAERIELLRAEIGRLEQAMEAKKASASHAATFFRK